MTTRMIMDIVRLLPFVVEQELAKTCFSKLRKSGFQLVQRIGEDFVKEKKKQDPTRLFGRRLLPGIAPGSGTRRTPLSLLEAVLCNGSLSRGYLAGQSFDRKSIS